MYLIHFTNVIGLFCFISLVVGHSRIRRPIPLAAAVENPGGNYYNSPLRPDGSDFPCKGLHKRAGVDMTPTETWQPGQQTRFEILGHGPSGGEGSMAAHSGGSCQASLSFNNGETWKVLHSYTGGCPRGARLGSNMGSTNQTFTFTVPVNTKAGRALFSWSWVAVTGNRNEYYQNCASVSIAGSGTSTLDDLPDMFVGDMTLSGQIGAGECRSTAGYALEYPNPGKANTITQVPSIGFKKPTGGKCFTKASTSSLTTSRPSISTVSSSTTTSTKSGTTTRSSSTTSRVSSTSTKPTTTRVSTTSRVPSTSTKPTTTRVSTTSRVPSTSTKPTTTRVSTTSRVPSTSTKPTTTRVSTTSRVPSTSTKPITTRVSTASRVLTQAVTTSMTNSTVLPPPVGGLPSQCSSYMLITDKTRHASHPGHIGCDNAIFKKLPTWVRFSGGAGTRLVRGPAEPFRCGTQGAGWYSGSYPLAAGATISATVCYSWPGKSCQWSNAISITNCKDYYVFALPAPPACYLRYCTS